MQAAERRGDHEPRHPPPHVRRAIDGEVGDHDERNQHREVEDGLRVGQERHGDEERHARDHPRAAQVAQAGEDHEEDDGVHGMADEGGEVREGEPRGEDRQHDQRGGGGERGRGPAAQAARDAEDDPGLEAVDDGGHDGDRDLGTIAREPDERPAQHVEHRRIGERVPVPVLELQAEAEAVLVRGELLEEADEAVARELPGEQRVHLDVGIVELRVQHQHQAQGERAQRRQHQARRRRGASPRGGPRAAAAIAPPPRPAPRSRRRSARLRRRSARRRSRPTRCPRWPAPARSRHARAPTRAARRRGEESAKAAATTSASRSAWPRRERESALAAHDLQPVEGDAERARVHRRGLDGDRRAGSPDSDGGSGRSIVRYGACRSAWMSNRPTATSVGVDCNFCWLNKMASQTRPQAQPVAGHAPRAG